MAFRFGKSDKENLERTDSEAKWTKTLNMLQATLTARATPRTPHEQEAVHVGHVGSDASLESLEAPKTSVSQRLQRVLNCWVVQIFYFALSALHCSCYMVNLDDLSDEELDQVMLWVMGTGAPLAILTAFELLVRVSAQAGIPYHWRSWRRFCLPLFHKFELLVFIGMFGRACMSSYLLVISVTGEEFESEVYSSDRMTVNVLIFYRCLRIWGIYYGVSVQATERKNSDRENREAVWMEEHIKERQKYLERMSVRLQGAVNQAPVQFVLWLLLIIHCTIYALTRTFDSWQSAYWITKPSGYLLVSCFAAELAIRIYAQGGEHFFRPCLHQAEVFMLVVGLLMVGYSTWYHEAIREARNNFEVSGTAVGVILSLNRFLRFLGIWYGVSASEWDAHSLFEAQANTLFMRKLGDVLEVPPENVNLKLAGDIMVHVRKAKIKPEAFRGIHLPITVRGGLVEDVQVKVPQPLLKKAGKHGKEPTTSFHVKNLLFIVGPGEGLAEAGGLEPAGQYWNYENVLKAKTQLVELICKRMPPPPSASTKAESENPDADDDESGDDSENGEEVDKSEDKREGTPNPKGLRGIGGAMRSAMAQVKQKAKALGKAAVLKRVEVNIQNVTLQYEDNGALGRGHVAIGMKVGKIWMLRQQAKELEWQILRLGCFIETQTRKKAQQRAKYVREQKNEVLARMDKSVTVTRFQHKPSFMGTYASSSDHRQRSASSSGLEVSGGTERQQLQRAASSRINDPGDPWSSRLSRLLEASPKLALRELRCIEVGERLRLWGLNAMDKERHLTSRQQHLVSERWPEQRLVCSLLHLRLHAKPEKPHHHSEAEPWTWSVTLAPARVVIDEEQVRCLRSLQKCVKAWMANDEAFRWRPDVPKMAVQDPSAHDGSGGEATQEERSTVWRLWWIYATHRVLARKHIQLRSLHLNMKWRTMSMREYSQLLKEVMWQTTHSLATLQDGCLSWKWMPWQSRWAQELEARLSTLDVLACRKKTLGMAAQQVAEKKRKLQKTVSSSSERLGSAFRWRILGTEQTESAHKLLEAKENTKLAVRNVTDAMRRLDVDQAGEHMQQVIGDGTQAARQAAENALDTVVGVTIGVADDVRDLTNDLAEQAKDSVRTSRITPGETSNEPASPILEESAQEQQLTMTGSKSTKPDEAGPWSMLKGKWQVFIPKVEVRLVRWGSFPRPVLLHVLAQTVDISANVSQVPADSPEEVPRGHIKATLSVTDFQVTSPQGGPLTLGGGINVCRVERPILLGAPSSPILPDGREILEAIPVSKPLAFAVRMAGTHGEKGLCEVHTPGISFMVYEPLFVVLLSYAQVDQEIGGQQSWRLVRRRGPMPSTRTSTVPFSKKSRPHSSKGLSVKTGRIGPNAQSLIVNDTEESVAMATMKTKFHEYCDTVYHRRANSMENKQKFFERVVGLQGLTIGFDADLNIGAIHLMQIGEYGPTSLFVEDLRVRPFKGGSLRGLSRPEDEKLSEHEAFGRYRVSMQANGDAESRISPWNGSGWSTEDGFHIPSTDKGAVNTAADVEGKVKQSQATLSPEDTPPYSEEEDCYRCCNSSQSEKLRMVKKQRMSIPPSPFLKNLPILVEPDKAQQKEALGAQASELSTFEVSLLLVPRTKFSPAWVAEANKQWLQTAYWHPQVRVSM